MAQIRHLNRAPVREAIFDFRVKAANDFQVEDFKNLQGKLASPFPKLEERRGGQVTIGFKPGLPEVFSEDFGPQGYFYKSDDEKLIAQFRIDGFTLNRLAPYSSWAELFPLANELWGQYCEIATPQTVTRLALRYINHIPLPWPTVDLDEFLESGPRIPAALPHTIAGFQSQVLISDEANSIFATVGQKLETSVEEKTSAILLDIDAFKVVDLAPYSEDIQAVFGNIRDFKNMIFFNYLTEKAIGGFE